MVADKRPLSKEALKWFEDRRILDTAVRRSPEVSSSAYRLWAELIYGWAWYEPSCYPSCTTLAAALGTTERTVFRLLSELEGHGLISRRRLRLSNMYTIVTEIPQKFRDPRKLNNTKIVAEVKARGLAAFQDPHHEVVHDVCGPSHQETGSATPDVMISSGEGKGSGPDELIRSDVMDSSVEGASPDELIRSDVMDSSHKDEEEKSRSQNRKNKKEKREPAPASPAFSEHSGMSGHPRASRGNQGSGVAMAEADELIEEAEGQPSSRPTRKRKPRAGSPALVSGAGHVQQPFPDALRASESPSEIQFDSQPPPPPVEKPMDVLRLLKGEAETRWGKKSTHGYPMDLTGELTGQVKNVLLTKYAPDVILAMTRLLVWDWEVARGACFPFRHGVPYPDVKALVQYAGELASRIETGFDYMRHRRGASNTYHDLFIRKIPFVKDDNPF